MVTQKYIINRLLPVPFSNKYDDSDLVLSVASVLCVLKFAFVFSLFLFMCRRLLDGHAGSAIKVLVAIHYSVLDARNGYIRNVVV